MLKFWRNALCHSSCVSHTLYDVSVGRCTLQCLFHQIQGTGDSATPSDIQTYSMTTGEGMHWDRKTNKKITQLISAKCVSFTARFKLMGLILSAPKNSLYSTNFQCHWICLCVSRRAEVGVGVWVGAEITVNVTLPPLSIIHFQSIAVPGFVRQLGDDASKMGSIA